MKKLIIGGIKFILLFLILLFISPPVFVEAEVVEKTIKDYKVLNKAVAKAQVKANETDSGGNFYVYDLYDESGKCVALNRYVYINSNEQPFDALTVEEEKILNPPTVEEIMK